VKLGRAPKRRVNVRQDIRGAHVTVELRALHHPRRLNRRSA